MGGLRKQGSEKEYTHQFLSRNLVQGTGKARIDASTVHVTELLGEEQARPNLLLERALGKFHKGFFNISVKVSFLQGQTLELQEMGVCGISWVSQKVIEC